ncbi:MAG TPA: hypothetical protein PLI09_06445 [Candidatus Hydrogenedentes bacterium]|nr:hypothetical protein [Candidatus Hydrogenedentota bacterium]
MRYMLIRYCLGILCIVMVFSLLQGCPCNKKYTLTLTVAPENAGTVQAAPGAATYAAGSVVTLTAAPAAGWRFGSWEGGVAESSVPLTTVTINGDIVIMAHFSAAALAGEANASLELDADGINEDMCLTIQDGSELNLPAGLRISKLEELQTEGPAEILLRDRMVSELQPTGFANWLWAFDVAVVFAGEESEFLFTSLSDESVVDPEYYAAGGLLTVPLGGFGLPAGTELELYKLEIPATDDAQAWRRVACSTVEDNETVSFSIHQTGRYAIGKRPLVHMSVAPDLGATPLYDCVVEAEAPMDRVKVIEESTAEVFNAWVFTDIAPGTMPETTDWYVHNGEEPCMGRLENYGRRFRMRSPYANAFSAAYGLQGEKQERAAMTGPYEVDADGNPAATPLENPYGQCDRIFAGEVKVLVLSRAGDYALFISEVVTPLRAVFDTGKDGSSNVHISWFKKLREGYYAEVWVRTEECTMHVANAAAIIKEEGVSISLMTGRAIYIVDWRGGGPYVAVYTTVAHNTGVGLRFYDPYWNLEDGIIDEHSIGGPNNNILKLVDMEYDCIHDTLWVIKADENGIFNLFRYDKPIYRFGDRAPDARIDFPTFALRELYVDPENDRLYVHTSGSPDEDGDGLRVFSNASTEPVLENRVTHIAFHYPDETGPDMLMYEYIVPMGNTLLLVDNYTLYSPPRDGLEVFTYNLSSSDFGANFQAWASFGGENTAPITKGVFSRHNNILYAGTDDDWNGHTSVYAIDAPSSWQSQWIVDPETENGYWSPDTPNYRALSWASPADIWDIDVVEGDQEILAVCQQPALNQAEILLFNNANTASGVLEPFYRRAFDQGMQRIELINPPKPLEEK